MRVKEMLKRPLYNYLVRHRSERKADSAIRAKYTLLDEGSGIGTFSTDIRALQPYFISKRKISQFEHTMYKWERNSFDESNGGSPEVSYVMYGHRDESKNYTVTYDNIDKKGKTTHIQVEFGSNYIIRTITFKIFEDNINKIKIKDYIHRLKSMGYKLDVASTRIAHAYDLYDVTYMMNAKNHIRVRLLPSDFGTLVTVLRGR